MRNVLYFFVALFLILAVLAYLGPKPKPVQQVGLHPVALADDLDKFLAEREAKVPNLRPELAQHIQWDNPQTKARTPLAIVYLHSYTGSSKELTPVIETLGHNLHANIYFNRYHGHGQDSAAMAAPTVEDWLQDTNESLEIGKRLGERVAVIGFSTGGTLATWLAALQAPIVAQVLLSPNYAPRDWRANLLLLPWGDSLVSAANHGKRYREWIPENELQRARWTPKQPVESLITMMSLVRYVNALDFKKVTVPTLCLYTDIDKTVSVPKIKEAFAKFSSATKELVDFPDARWHVMTGDAFSPNTNEKVIERMTAFLQPYSTSSGR